MCSGCRAANSGLFKCGTPGPCKPGFGRTRGRPAPTRLPPRFGNGRASCLGFMIRLAYLLHERGASRKMRPATLAQTKYIPHGLDQRLLLHAAAIAQRDRGQLRDVPEVEDINLEAASGGGLGLCRDSRKSDCRFCRLRHNAQRSADAPYAFVFSRGLSLRRYDSPSMTRS
jgi:hypothetical protein